MAEFSLPANSKVQPGKTYPAPAGATRTKTFKVYRGVQGKVLRRRGPNGLEGGAGCVARPAFVHALRNDVQFLPPQARVS